MYDLTLFDNGLRAEWRYPRANTELEDDMILGQIGQGGHAIKTIQKTLLVLVLRHLTEDPSLSSIPADNWVNLKE